MACFGLDQKEPLASRSSFMLSNLLAMHLFAEVVDFESVFHVAPCGDERICALQSSVPF
jgi:hypothetical protein